MSAASPTPQEYKRLTQHDVDVICAKHDRLWSARLDGARAVFAFCDISGLSMTGRNLCDADFTGAVLVGCDLRKTRLDNANFYGADMQGADLSDASLRRADLRGASLRGANLTGADMFEADLREGTIAAADRKEGYRVIELTQREAYASGANLSGANLERSRRSSPPASPMSTASSTATCCRPPAPTSRAPTWRGRTFATPFWWAPRRYRGTSTTPISKAP